MKKTIPVLLFFLTFSGVSMASGVIMRGSTSCGEWAKDRDGYNTTWLLGYLSGIASNSNKDFLRNTDASSIALWVDNYCQANPLNHLFDAGDKLSKELIRKNGL